MVPLMMICFMGLVFVFDPGAGLALGLLSLAVWVVVSTPNSSKNHQSQTDLSEITMEDSAVYPSYPAVSRVRPIGLNYGDLDLVRPLGSSTVISPPSAKAVLASTNPQALVELLRQRSQNETLVELSNSAMGVEFAKTGKGISSGTRRSRSWFGGTETTEFFIRPVD